jgi:hypothetical protein
MHYPEYMRKRVIKLAQDLEGVNCPELVVIKAMPVYGTGHSGQVEFRCSEEENAPTYTLMLNEGQAEYVGIDTSPPDFTET